jgi:hypothetical protein
MTSLETNVLGLLQSRHESPIDMSEEILAKITTIKKQCQQAVDLESSESTLHSWRKPASKPTWRSGPNQPLRNQRPPSAGFRPANTVTPTTNPGQRYVSKFQNTDNHDVEDKILNNIILSKLNKFSVTNYEEVKAFLQQILDSDEKVFLKEFMKLVFKKAASEITFCPLYARMLSELSEKYTVLVEEMMIIYESYLSIFDEITESQCPDYETFIKRNREKTYRLGYSQFLAELTTFGSLKLEALLRMYNKLCSQIMVLSEKDGAHTVLIEEYVDCLLRMTRGFSKTSEKLDSIRKGLLVEIEPVLTNILANKSQLYPGVSKKAGFGIMDCIDILRS